MPPPLVKSFAKKAGTSSARVHKLWKKAKQIAAKADKGDNYAYIVGVLKRMLHIEGTSGEAQVSPDYSLLIEAWGPEIAAHILTETMPGFVKAALAMRWLEIERQLRNGPDRANWGQVMRSMRMAVYTLLRWAAREPQGESYQHSAGII